MKGAGIYSITRVGTDQCYVGSAVDMARRWRRHRGDLRCGRHHAAHLQRAWAKHGESAFSFAVLESVSVTGLESDAVRALLTAAEQRWIDRLKPAFNTLEQASSTLGYRHTAEAKKRIADANRGLDYSTRGAKISAAKKGHRHSEATKEKLRLAITGKRHTPEAKAKIAAANLRRAANANMGAGRDR